MRDIIFLISEMSGGGAERVITVLCNEFCKKTNVSLIITRGCKDNSRLEYLNDKVDVVFLSDMAQRKSSVPAQLIMLIARFFGKIGFAKESLVLKYLSRNYLPVKALKAFLRNYRKATLISFLNEPIFLTLLAGYRKNRIIISERNDPSNFISNRTTMSFIHKMYPKADMLVCQSPDAQKWYDNNSRVKSTVIFNPIKSNLPLAFAGERSKKIVNFCRISTQKNLKLLVDAFEMLYEKFPEYMLYIYGDAVGNGAEGYKEEVEDYINRKNLAEKIIILPARSDIHDIIKDSAMFVSSSDFEGMSNSMLEAMAMGMPVVCTDCPAGGARAVIKDHENGLLTPVGDAEALYKAMKEIIETPALAKKLGENAAKIREDQSVQKITEKWMEIINA